MKAYKERIFWSKVQKSDTCWIWIGHSHRGYGRYSMTGAHRVSFEIAHGAIPQGLELDHLCRNPLCVRPDHLEPVTRLENIRRRCELQTHCKHGHEFTPENTYSPGRRRVCRACNARRQRDRKARMTAAGATS